MCGLHRQANSRENFCRMICDSRNSSPLFLRTLSSIEDGPSRAAPPAIMAGRYICFLPMKPLVVSPLVAEFFPEEWRSPTQKTAIFHPPSC